MLSKAKQLFDFYETPKHHSDFIFNDYNASLSVKVIDICCGFGSLVQPWYDNGHNITLIELNEDFIPILQLKFPNARIFKEDYLSFNDNE